jgi:hypothetical protein
MCLYRSPLFTLGERTALCVPRINSRLLSEAAGENPLPVFAL